ncbi:MAG: DNA polymerase III subunit delta [Candidatus Marinimicrobia bacterium]|nr:DNA polymerase III subunit delta [Candidatus Neomarinimicrobiota bacterium]MCF7829819.1 DNA polymerase III subunit delta [Candidatus Neomarinimicrobiota bacterium]MCF7881748.1 DNA polymerase III subunit delta [Candidatus Neomarinimicrobiota bacterium]
MARQSPVEQYFDKIQALQDDLQPAYFLYGEEVYLQDTFLEAVYNAFQDRYGSQWTKYVYHCTEIEPETILEQLVSDSLFSEPKVIVIKELDSFDDKKQGGKAALLDYLGNPSGDITLVLLKESTRVSDKFSKKLKKAAVPIEVRIPWMREMDAWVQHFLREKGIQADMETRSRLIDMAGESLQQLANELEKLKIYLPENTPALTPELLNEFVGETRTHSVFEFADVLGSKSLPEILEYLFSLLDEGVSVSYILKTTADFYERMWIISEMMAANKSDKEINREVFNGRNLAWKYKKLGNRFQSREIQRAFPLLEEADLLTKTTSALEEKNYMSALFIELFKQEQVALHE